MSSRKKIIVLISTLIILLGAGITIYFSKTDDDTLIASSENEVNEIHISHDLLTATDLSDMINNSDLIVLGTYEGFDSTWNMARDPNDLSEESDEAYIEGKIYNFNVEEVLMGEVENSKIKINHSYSETLTVELTSGDEVVSPEGVLIKEPTSVEYREIENKDPTFIEPNFNDRYIVFLQKGEINNIYMRAIEPYLIKFDENETAILQSNLTNNDNDTLNNNITIDGKTISITNEVDTDFKDSISGKKLKYVIEEIKK